ncbi:MAG: hypothetical protein ACYCXA_00120 [Actinomycetes bacterium]|nr:hypothetical protein [Haloactinopolyspora sp.]
MMPLPLARTPSAQQAARACPAASFLPDVGGVALVAPRLLAPVGIR